MMLVSQTDRHRNDVVRIDSIATITLVAVMFWLDSSSFLKEVKITMFLNEKEKGKKEKKEREIVVCGSSFFSASTWWGTFPVPVLARCCFLQLVGKWQYQTKFLLQLN